jgi:hypothetical protein
METVFISALDTVELIAAALRKEFPQTTFDVRPEDEPADGTQICGVDVEWRSGPSREQVEDLVDRYQGVRWDPGTGTLEGRSHWVIDGGGRLVRIIYNIDYIFCSGPSEIVLQN